MIRLRAAFVIAALSPFACACGGSTLAQGDGGTSDAQADSPQPPAPVDKLDLLFMIDNTSTMGDVQTLLAKAVPEMIQRLLSPNCVDAQGNVVGVSQAGRCTQGQLEFQPVDDMHIGIVSSSLGGQGSDACDPLQNPVPDAHNNDRGELVNRGGPNETYVIDASPSNFLAWLPSVPDNQGKPQPPVPAIGDATQLITDFQDMVSGVHEHGCGFQAQLESWYRFLVQPDPFDSIQKDATRASLVGIDATILQQRHDFLRPDSALAVIVVSNHNERTPDPILIGGQGWAFANTAFPGSPNGSAPRGTVECQQPVDPNNVGSTGPNDPNCTSCAFIQAMGVNFNADCPGGAYLDATDDNLNVRFFHQKERFGLDAMDPIGKYVVGLTSPQVASSGRALARDTDHEHDASGNYVGDRSAQQNCVNPIFAADLPIDPTADLCHLTRGPRTAGQVFFATITGVPQHLLQPSGATPTASDWVRILGNDPEHYDFAGADFHMLESLTDRPGTTCPAATAADDCDPANGREWNTRKSDLQFACIFDIRPQYGGVGKDCGNAAYTGACDCAQNSQTRDTPLCSKMAGNNPDPVGYTDLQISDKAYPGIRELEVARALGDRAVVSSICPVHVTDNAQNDDPLYGYRPAMKALVDKLSTVLQK
jgi:hypothetical protein